MEDEALERQMEDKLREALRRFDSPAEQFERLEL